jgi:hypothetical protein
MKEIKMLDFIGTVAITAAMVVNISAVVSSLPASSAQRIVAAVAVGLWIGLAAASANAGILGISHPIPYIGLYVAFPLAATAVLVAISPAWRAALLGLPTPLLIGLNVSRLFGALFLVLEANGRLSGPFPFSAGWGDIIVGALALPALWLAGRPSQGGHSLLAAWNLFGALDLVVAIALGVTSAPESPFQLLHVGAGSTAMQLLPWAFIPAVLVPFYLIMHGVLFVQLRWAANPDDRDQLAARGIAQT